MGCERNADAVQMVSYAPLLAHVEGRTWDWHGMIYHDGTRVFGTVSYYLWKLFGLNRPSYTVRTDVKLEAAKPPAIAGAIGVGTWNTSAEFKDIRVEKDGKTLYASDFAQGAADWQAGRRPLDRRGRGLSPEQAGRGTELLRRRKLVRLHADPQSPQDQRCRGVPRGLRPQGPEQILVERRRLGQSRARHRAQPEPGRPARARPESRPAAGTTSRSSSPAIASAAISTAS